MGTPATGTRKKASGSSHHSENHFSHLILVQHFLRRGEQKTAAHYPLGDSRWRSSYIFVHPPSVLHLFSSKPLIPLSLALPLSSPSWLLLLGQQAPPSHLLHYFFTFNRPRRRPLRLIQSIYVVANN